MENDQLIYKTGGSFIWLPGRGQCLDDDQSSYRQFTHLVRTLHVQDAVQASIKKRLEPKPISDFCRLKQNWLPSGHPCANLQVLWFGTRSIWPSGDLDLQGDHNCYGNVQFAIPSSLLTKLWKYCFFVEMVTTYSSTTSHILITNNDYSSVLEHYYPEKQGGPWQISNGHYLSQKDTARYNGIGSNKKGHILEFMIETSPEDETNIFSLCELSFVNHEKASNLHAYYLCPRYRCKKCPTPLSISSAANVFFHLMKGYQIPKLSSGAKNLYKFFKVNTIDVNPNILPILPDIQPMKNVPLDVYKQYQQTQSISLLNSNKVFGANSQLTVLDKDSPGKPPFLNLKKNASLYSHGILPYQVHCEFASACLKWFTDVHTTGKKYTKLSEKIPKGKKFKMDQTLSFHPLLTTSDSALQFCTSRSVLSTASEAENIKKAQIIGKTVHDSQKHLELNISHNTEPSVDILLGFLSLIMQNSNVLLIHKKKLFDSIPISAANVIGQKGTLCFRQTPWASTEVHDKKKFETSWAPGPTAAQCNVLLSYLNSDATTTQQGVSWAPGPSKLQKSVIENHLGVN